MGVTPDNGAPHNLSGGEWARRCLVQALAEPHDLLLFDEPSAHLDQSGLQLLLDALETEPTLLLVTHDRRLLEGFCSRLWIIQENSLIDFPGTYSQWQIEKDYQQKSRENTYEAYLREKAHLTQVIQNQKEKAQALGRKPKNKTSTELKQIGYGSVGKSIKGKQKALSAQVRHNEKRLQSLPVVGKPVQPPRIRPDFTLTNPPQNRVILQSESLTFGYSQNALLFEDAHFVLERNHKVALLGENGSGKSTLLNLIRQGHPDIYRVPKAKFGFFSQKFETVRPYQTVLENVRQVSCQNETITRQILAQMRFSKSQWDQKAGTLSGGELTCLAFAQLFVSNANVLLIDEPGNYLDLPSREAIEQLLIDYEGTLLFTSHDSTFVNHIAQEKWLIEGQKITQKG